MTSVHCDSNSCCLVRAFRQSYGRDLALQHYLKAISSVADCNSVHVKEEETDSFDSEPWGATSQPTSVDTRSSCHYSASPKSHLQGYPILLCNAKLKLQHNVQLFVCDKSVMNKMEVCLTIVGNKIGKAEPYLHMWDDHSSFVWQLSDNLESNTVRGQRKPSMMWFFIPDSCVALLHMYLQKHLNLKVGTATCLTAALSDAGNYNPQQIQMSVVVQDLRELEILCHCSSDKGPSTDEAASFAIQVRISAGYSLQPGS